MKLLLTPKIAEYFMVNTDTMCSVPLCQVPLAQLAPVLQGRHRHRHPLAQLAPVLQGRHRHRPGLPPRRSF